MNKYLTVFSASWQSEFTYRVNFMLWRLRNVLRLLMTYFLWRGIFVSNQNVFGYSQPQMLTYVFLVLIVQSMVVSAPSADSIGGEIASGDLSNYLVKPFGYLKYWFTRDLASKLLNMVFAVVEISLLWVWLRPEIVVPNNLLVITGFVLSLVLAIGNYYLLGCLARFIAFWQPENSWGLAFVVLVFLEILGGGIFPLNVLPEKIYALIQFTPFPYLVYFPIAIFTGKIVGAEMIRILFQSLIWVGILFLLTKYFWKKGMVVYQA